MTDEDHVEAVTKAWHVLNDSREKAVREFWKAVGRVRGSGLKVDTAEDASIPVN